MILCYMNLFRVLCALLCSVHVHVALRIWHHVIQQSPLVPYVQLTRKSNGSSSAKRRKKDDETSSVVGGAKKSKVREAPDQATMTMQELIYYNPTVNPMR